MSIAIALLRPACLRRRIVHRAGLSRHGGFSSELVPESALLGRRPRRRAQEATAVARETDRVAGFERAIPEIARDLLVALVEPLAVIREIAAQYTELVSATDILDTLT